MLSAIFFETLKRCSVENLVVAKLPAKLAGVSASKKIWLFGAGKAAASMARGVLHVCGARVVGGAIIIPSDTERGLENLEQVQVLRGTHPRPSSVSVAATEALIKQIENCHSQEHAVFALSGGASALLCHPSDGLSVETKADISDALMAAGAPISEINTVRKHLSSVKGGQLGPHFKCPVTVLVLSDVASNSIENVGSGPLALDSTTRADAEKILQRRLKQNMNELIETPKKSSEFESAIEHVVVGTGFDLAKTAASVASEYGFSEIFCEPRAVEEEVGSVADFYAQFVRAYDKQRPLLLIRYGEPTVVMGHASGQGGRNQHLALLLAKELQGISGWQFLAAGSDGIDGNTTSAGAVVDGQSWLQAVNNGVDVENSLNGFESHAVHKSLKSLINSGPTGNNLQDLHLLILR